MVLLLLLPDEHSAIFNANTQFPLHLRRWAGTLKIIQCSLLCQKNCCVYHCNNCRLFYMQRLSSGRYGEAAGILGFRG
jgi:hypothetical protein